MRTSQDPKRMKSSYFVRKDKETAGMRKETTEGQKDKKSLNTPYSAAIGNTDLIELLSQSAVQRKNLYDEMDFATNFKVDEGMKEGLIGYQATAEEKMMQKAPRQILSVSTPKGSFSIGKRGENDELVLTSSIKNTAGQSVTNNDQKELDMSSTTVSRGRLTVFRNNYNLQYGAVVMSSKENIYHAGKLSEKISDRMIRENRLETLDLTAPFLNREKESLSMLTLRKRMERLSEKQKRIDSMRDKMQVDSEERVNNEEKKRIQKKLEKCKSVFSEKEQAANRFTKAFEKTVKPEQETEKAAGNDSSKISKKKSYFMIPFIAGYDDEEENGETKKATSNNVKLVRKKHRRNKPEQQQKTKLED